MSKLLHEKIVPPAIEIVKRILDVFFLFDVSYSMSGKRIAVSNQAMREIIAQLLDIIKNHPEVELRIRCIAFSDSAEWHIGPDPVSIGNVFWSDLSAGGCTSTGAAVELLANQVRMANMPKKGLPPVMILVSDGDNTDGNKYEIAIAELEKEPWGVKAVRLSIGIGKSYNKARLEKFTNHPEVGVLEAKTAVDLVNYIRYASTVAIKSSIESTPDALCPMNNVQLPPAPPAQKPGGNMKMEVL